jgi:DNA end-binding protein Ku
MRSSWNGMLCVGAVHMPVKLYSATRSTELHFHYLHGQDGGRIKNERICAKCGQTVDADELVRGYEVEKGTYVTLTEEDFEKVDVDGAHTLSVDAFVDPAEIDPIFFDKPYYLAPEEKSAHLYMLLREALKRTQKVAVAKLVFHERELLAVIKPNGRALMLAILYFSDELAPPKGLTLPKANTALDDEEMAMAERLIDSMTDHFAPEKYTDTYQEGLQALIEKKREGATIKAKPQRQRTATDDADLLAALKASIQRAEGKRKRALAA